MSGLDFKYRNEDPDDDNEDPDYDNENLDFSSHQGGTYGLRTLTFKNCELSKAELELLLRIYTTREWYPNFEGIIFEQCKGVKLEDLTSVVHSEHVLFRDEWL
jgi:hypothetical protein